MFLQVIRGDVAEQSALDKAMQRWASDVRPGAVGFLGSTWGTTTTGEVVLVARFEDEAAARQNSDRAEQTSWWSEFEAALSGEPTVLETSQVDLSMGGGSNDAGFVQIFWGEGDREAAARVMARAEPILRKERSDIVGGITGWFGDGQFMDVAYFRSEAEARDGESKELTPEGQALFEEFGRVLPANEYLDLPNPQFI